MKNIEVELRSFISKEKYDELKKYFDKNTKFINEDNQETHYFDCVQDLRIQKNDHYSKVWLKKGKLHDDAREEIEIKFDKNNFAKAEELFKALNHEVEIKWFRKRLTYAWDIVDVMLDYTKGFGYILEMEILSEEEKKEEALQILKDRFKQLHIEISPKEEFKKQFDNYKQNWQELIKD